MKSITLLVSFATLLSPSLASQHFGDAHLVVKRDMGLAYASAPASSYSSAAASTVSAINGSASSVAIVSNASSTTSSLSSTATTSVSSNASAVSANASSAAVGSSADLTVLNLAFTLEQLESQFYAEGLKKWSRSDYISAGFSERQSTIIIEQLTIIQSDESTHSSTLESVIVSLGSEAITTCTFNFDSVLQDPMTFISVARSLESVGVSAYLGAAHLLTDPALLTAAASILTLESRHQSLLNIFNGGSFAPQAFDIALSPQQVLALAGGFLEGCTAADLGLTSNEPLSIVEQVSQSTRFSTGSQLEFSSTVTIESTGQFCQMIIGGAAVAQVFPAESCMIPTGVNGPVAVYITSSNTPLQSNILEQDITVIIAGPGLIFVDSVHEEISTLFQTRKSRGMGSANFGYMGTHSRSSNRVEIIQVVVRETETVILREDSRSGRSGSNRVEKKSKKHHKHKGGKKQRIA